MSDSGKSDTAGPNVQPIDPEAVEQMCADLCVRLGRHVPAGTATQKVFGVMAGLAENIEFMNFNLGHADPDLSTIPLPFSIDENQEVMLLEDYDQKAVCTSFARAVSLFRGYKRNNQTSVLVAATNRKWAVVVNEDGGVVYWSQKP